jgi:hypothetical protein
VFVFNRWNSAEAASNLEKSQLYIIKLHNLAVLITYTSLNNNRLERRARGAECAR